MGAIFSDRKVRSLSFQDKGKHLTAKIGKKFALYLQEDEPEDEEVLIIFYDRRRNEYFICTWNSGVKTGPPISVGGNCVYEFEDFDADNT